MTMFPKIDLPSRLPRYGTNSAYQEEPPEADKTLGHSLGERSPAYWENWRTNLVYEWCQKIAGTQLMNWKQGTDVLADDCESAIFHPEVGYWVITSVSELTSFHSTDGITFTTGSSMGAYPIENVIGIDTTNYIIANANNDLKYSADGGQTAWSTAASATIGGSGTIGAMCTKYPDSDFVMVARGSNPVQIRIGSTGVSGTWAAPTTGPTGMASGAVAKSLIFTGGTTWILQVAQIGFNETQIYISTDDGDTWAASDTDPPFSSAAVGGYRSAYHQRSTTAGRLIVVGHETPVTGPSRGVAFYTDDLGTTWTEATLNFQGLDTDVYIKGIYYAGGDTWIGTYKASGGDPKVIISVDNGENWKIADIDGSSPSAGTDGDIIACNERQIMIFGSDGYNIKTLAS